MMGHASDDAYLDIMGDSGNQDSVFGTRGYYSARVTSYFVAPDEISLHSPTPLLAVQVLCVAQNRYDTHLTFAFPEGETNKFVQAALLSRDTNTGKVTMFSSNFTQLHACRSCKSRIIKENESTPWQIVSERDRR